MQIIETNHSHPITPKANPENKRQIYFTETEVAERLGMSVEWLRKNRRNRTEITFSKFSNRVRYHIDDIEAYEQSRKITPIIPQY